MHPQWPGPPPTTSGGNTALLAKAPPLPILLAVILVLTLIIGGASSTGGATGRPNTAAGESSTSSKSELCSAYRAVNDAHSDLTGTKDLGPPLVTLAEVAQKYPDSVIQREGRAISKYSENVIYVENLPAQISNIRFECR